MAEHAQGPYLSATLTTPDAPRRGRRRAAWGLLATLGGLAGAAVACAEFMREPTVAVAVVSRAPVAPPRRTAPVALDAIPMRPLRGVVGFVRDAPWPCAKTASEGVYCWDDERTPYLSLEPLRALASRGEGRLLEHAARQQRTTGAEPRVSEAREGTETRGAIDFAVWRDTQCALMPSTEVLCWSTRNTVVNGPDPRMGVPSENLGRGLWRRNPFPSAVEGLRDVVGLALGDQHACAFDRGGDVRCWGGNDRLQRGDADVEDHYAPERSVEGLGDVVELAAKDWTTCARTRRGEVFCWGYGPTGILGPRSRCRGSFSPLLVELPRRAQGISVDGQMACALLDDGRVWCWGAGMEPPENRCPWAIPTEVRGLERVQRLVGVQNYTCTVSDRERLSCWDWQRVFARSVDSEVPSFEVPGLRALSPSPSRQICGISHDQGPFCGEYNYMHINRDEVFPTLAGAVQVAQAGVPDLGGEVLYGVDGAGVLRATTPWPGDGMRGVREVFASELFACALHEDGTVSCWGDNNRGQLGRGGAALTTPMRVMVRAD